MANAIEIDDSTFEAEVLESEIPVIVDFSAEWCGPCKQLTPIIDALAKDYGERVKVGKVDVDNAQETAGKYAITSVPTVLFFKGGEKVDTLVGLNAKRVYESKIEGLLAQ